MVRWLGGIGVSTSRLLLLTPCCSTSVPRCGWWFGSCGLIPDMVDAVRCSSYSTLLIPSKPNQTPGLPSKCAHYLAVPRPPSNNGCCCVLSAGD